MLKFDWTITFGDVIVVVGAGITFFSSAAMLLYRICKRLDNIESMAVTARDRTDRIDAEIHVDKPH